MIQMSLIRPGIISFWTKLITLDPILYTYINLHVYKHTNLGEQEFNGQQMAVQQDAQGSPIHQATATCIYLTTLIVQQLLSNTAILVILHTVA